MKRQVNAQGMVFYLASGMLILLLGVTWWKLPNLISTISIFFQFKPLIKFFFDFFLVASTIVVITSIASKFKNPIKSFQNLSVVDVERSSMREVIAGLILCVLATVVIIAARYSLSPHPKGFDTGDYVYTVEAMYFGGFMKIQSGSGLHPFVFLSLYPIALLFGGDPIAIGVTGPFVIGILFAFLTYLSGIIRGKTVMESTIISVVLSSTFFFVRLSYDLWSQTLFTGMLFVIFSLLSLQVSREKHSYGRTRRSGLLIFLGLFVMSMLLLSLTLTIVTVGFIFIFWALFVGVKPIHSEFLTLRRSIGVVGFLVLTVTLIVVTTIVFLFYLPKIRNITGLYGTIATKEIDLFNPPKDWDWIVYNESTIIVFLAATNITCLIIKKEKNSFATVCCLWTCYVYFIILTTGYTQPYRLVLLFPLGVMSGDALLRGLNCRFLQSTRLRIKVFNSTKSGSAFASIAILGVFVASVLPYATIAPYDYFPTDTVDDLISIRNRFGFNNSTNIYVLSPSPVGSPYWTKAFLGDYAYFGSPFSLVQSKPDIFGKSVNSTGWNLISLTNDRLLIGIPPDSILELGDSLVRINSSRLLDLLLIALESPDVFSDSYDFADFSFSNQTLKVWKSPSSVEYGTSLKVSYTGSTDNRIRFGASRMAGNLVNASAVILVYGGSIDENTTIVVELYREGNLVESARFFASSIRLSSTQRTLDVALFSVKSSFDEYRLILLDGRLNSEQSLDLVSIGFVS